MTSAKANGPQEIDRWKDAGTLTVGVVGNVEILQEYWDVIYEFIVFLPRGHAEIHM